MSRVKKLTQMVGTAVTTGAISLVVSAIAAGPALAAPSPTSPSSPSSDSKPTIYVALTGQDSATCGATLATACATIPQGIANANIGDTVLVEPGVYKEQVVVYKQIRLLGNKAVIDATGLSTGSGPTLNPTAVAITANGATVADFTVQGAYGEGILALHVSGVTIAHNIVTGNDLGTPANTTYFECQAQGEVPGDCGEGIHLLSTTHSAVRNNLVTGNSGGILITDEVGPSAYNQIVANAVMNNLSDCGITIPSHSSTAMDVNGVLHPSLGGDYNNLVSNNLVTGNGTMIGGGAGILIAAAGPGGASYNNTLRLNYIGGNGQAGVTIHSHTPQQDVSGNLITNNTISQNNIRGDGDANVTATTGILVFSAVVPTTERVSGNSITGNVNTIWTSPNVTILP